MAPSQFITKLGLRGGQFGSGRPEFLHPLGFGMEGGLQCGNLLAQLFALPGEGGRLELAFSEFLELPLQMSGLLGQALLQNLPILAGCS